MLQPGIYHPFFFWAPGRVVLAKMSAFVRRVRLTRLCMPMVLPHAKFLVRAVRHCVFRSQQDLLLSAAASVMSMIGRRPTFNAVMRVSETGSVACAIPRWYDPASAIRKRRLRQITQAISSTKCSSVGPCGTYSSTSPFRSADRAPRGGVRAAVDCALSGGVGRFGQAAAAGSLTKGSSLNGAMCGPR